MGEVRALHIRRGDHGGIARVVRRHGDAGHVLGERLARVPLVPAVRGAEQSVETRDVEHLPTTGADADTHPFEVRHTVLVGLHVGGQALGRAHEPEAPVCRPIHAGVPGRDPHGPVRREAVGRRDRRHGVVRQPVAHLGER